MSKTTISKHQAALERLHEGVISLLKSSSWTDALKFRAKFHAYSFFNTLLILSQYPTATLVSGYRKWQELGRQVRKGEKGITILAPLIRKDKDNPESKVLTGFRQVKVFDISQTDGEPIPTAPRPTLLEGNNALIQAAITALEEFCTVEGIPVDRELKHPSAFGMYRTTERSISLRSGMPKLQELKTLVHEVAHALLHQDTSVERIVAELEAESTAYLTLHQLGLDTSAYSFAYLANWTDSIESLIAAGEKASKASETILNAITPPLSREAVERLSEPPAAPSRPATSYFISN